MNKPNNRKNRKGYIRIAMLVILPVILVRAVLGIGSSALETAPVGYGDVRIGQQAGGIIVRRERVIKAPISGSISFIVKENVRVPANAKLLEVKKDKIDADLTKKYNEINQRLQVLQQTDSSAEAEVPEQVVEKGLSAIDFSMSEGNFAAVYYQKEELLREIGYSVAANTTQSEREELIQQKAELDEILAGGIKAEASPFSGVPVYTLDGYEEVLSPDNLEEIIPSQVLRSKVKKADLQKELNAGDPVMKIVDNHVWYFVCNLSKEFVGGMKQGSRVTLEVSDGQVHTVTAVVKNINIQDTEAIVVFESKDYFPGLYELRNIEMMVVKEKYSGYLVPLMAIIQEDGEYYTEVLEGDRIVRKEVIVRANDGVNAVIERSDTGPEIKMHDKVILKNR